MESQRLSIGSSLSIVLSRQLTCLMTSHLWINYTDMRFWTNDSLSLAETIFSRVIFENSFLCFEQRGWFYQNLSRSLSPCYWELTLVINKNKFRPHLKYKFHIHILNQTRHLIIIFIEFVHKQNEDFIEKQTEKIAVLNIVAFSDIEK